MARYIDADELLENLKKQYCEELGWQCTVNMSDVGMMIEDAPAADVVPRSEYDQLLDDFEHALHYAGKNNNVCNFCEHDCGEGGVCKGKKDFIECNPKWRGVVRSSAEGE